MSVYTTFSFAMLKVVTVNVRGMRDDKKRAGIFAALTRSAFDVVALQETHADHQVLPNWRREWPGLSCWSEAGPTSAGVALLFSPKLNVSILSHQADTAGRLLRVTVNIDSTTLQFAALYGPNPTLLSASNSFFRQIDTFVAPDLPLILLGDFNMVEHPFVDRLGGNIRLVNHTYGRDELQRFLKRHQLLDVWRKSNPSKREFTWHCTYNNVQSRLDRIYIPQSFLSHVHSTFITHFVWSDHDVCGVDLTLPTQQVRGKGYWRLNTQFLSRPDYRDRVRAFWLNWQHNRVDFDSDLLWWDCGKAYLKSLTIEYARDLHYTRKSRKLDLLDGLRRERALPAPDVSRLRDFEQALFDLERERNEKVFAHTHTVVREHREMPSKYFFNLLRARQQQSTVDALFTQDGNLVDTKDELLATAASFFEELYTTDPSVSTDSQNDFLDCITTSLTDSQRAALDKDVTLEELREVVFSCNTNKTAGYDGLPYEFYQTFWHEVGSDLLRVLNSALNVEHQLPFSQSRSILTLLYKKGDRRQLQNWRPISLLCCDYKIITKLLANRLKLVLSTLLSPRQAAGVPGRQITYHLHVIRDFIFFADANKIDGFILSLDQHKAFDTLDRPFLFKVLTKMNFSDRFIDWITTLHKETIGNVLVNGFISTTFSVSRGVRQGCPLSALLYSLYIEPFGLMIEKDRHIHPLRIPGRVAPKTLQYADDITLLLSADTSLYALFDVCHSFRRATGSTINLDKTQGLPLGNPDISAAIATRIHWCDAEGIEILGIHFFTDYKRTQNYNWMLLIGHLTAQLQKLQARPLSLKGKVLILNSIVLSRLWYIASVLPIPTSEFRELERQIFDFLWSGKTSPLQRRTVYLPHAEGGLALVHPLYKQNSLQLKLLNQVVLSDQHQTFTQLPRFWFGRRLAPVKHEWSFLASNALPHFVGPNLPPYYRDLLDMFLSLDMSKLPNSQTPWKTDTFYSQFMTTHKHHPRAFQDFWSAHGVNPVDMWKHVYTSYALGKHQGVHYRFLHRVLPTQAYMHQRFRGRGYANTDVKCLACPNAIETNEHLFFRCVASRPVLTYIYPSIQILLQGKPFKLFKIALNVFPPGVPIRHQQMAVTILQIAFYTIWTNRNTLKFEGSLPPLEGSQHKINFHFKSLMQEQFDAFMPAGLAQFRQKYCHTPRICSVHADNTLHVSLI